MHNKAFRKLKILKENPIEMNRHENQRHPSSLNQSRGDAASLLIKIQHQLSRLERKMDSIISMLQERQCRGNSIIDKSFEKKPIIKASRVSGSFNKRKSGRRNKKSGGRNTDVKFYSKFSK